MLRESKVGADSKGLRTHLGFELLKTSSIRKSIRIPIPIPPPPKEGTFRTIYSYRRYNNLNVMQITTRKEQVPKSPALQQSCCCSNSIASETVGTYFADLANAVFASIHIPGKNNQRVGALSLGHPEGFLEGL